MTRATRRHRCAENGCSEFAFYEFGTQREARDHSLRLAENPWRRTRHTQPESLLAHLFTAYLHTGSDLLRLLIGRGLSTTTAKSRDES